MGRHSRRLLSVLAVAALGLAACQKKGPSAVTADEMSMGNPQAKVTLIEYASVGCPYCAHFNNAEFPAFKAKYIDTGKVHYVFREMLVGSGTEVSEAAAGFLMARCVGRDKYFNMVDTLFHDQEAIFQSADVRDSLLKVAQSAGMSEKQFTDCVNDTDALKALDARVSKAEADGIDSTPTFILNGNKLGAGAMTADQLGAAAKAAGA